ncbi:MAG: MFS transporter [Propionibacteriaceae bacterium]|nr:MFS transporter [Propionibacteriaceae bacterium]
MARTGRLAWVVWSVGIFAYAVAIMQRTSLGVLGQQTSQHFGTSISIISTFVMVQLAVYALAQAPTGVLIDRYGSRMTMTVGSGVLVVSQVMMAFADTVPLAVTARILLAVGDACLFGSVLRLIPAWFAPSRVPVLSQLTGLLGQMGQVASATLLLPLFHWRGWLWTFLGAALLSAVALLASALWVQDVPPGETRPAPQEEKLAELPRGIVEAWKHPATRLGFWVHFTSGFSVNVFAMIWGIPWLMQAQGRSEADAAALFNLTVLCSIAFSPLLGWLTARHPLRRSNLALIVIWANVIMWAVVLLWPGQAPWLLLVALVIAMSAGGPGTGIGFDYPRTLLPPHRLGAANGLVITGSFTGATLCLLTISALLTALNPSGDYTPAQLNLAMAVQFPFFLVGIVGIFTTRHRLRTMMRPYGVVVPTWREVVERIRRSRRA